MKFSEYAQPQSSHQIGSVLCEFFESLTDHAGQVTIDKQSNIRTVVNKTDQIDNTFRFFKMELMAGEENYKAIVKENQCSFSLDYSTVYWNSRLRMEHAIVVDLMNAGEVVLDMFAGVGPFAIPAAKNKGCIVHGNDLNPHSYTYLMHNAKANKVASRVMAYNLDGREFVSMVTKKLVEKSLSVQMGAGKCEFTPYSHVIMNLPASAVKFLDTFRGLFGFVPEEDRLRLQLPLIHCYCFVEGGEEKEAVATVAANLGVAELEEGSFSVEQVRSISPKMMMIRVSFKLPKMVAYEKRKHLVMTQALHEGKAKAREDEGGEGRSGE